MAAACRGGLRPPAPAATACSHRRRLVDNVKDFAANAQAAACGGGLLLVDNAEGFIEIAPQAAAAAEGSSVMS